MTSPSVEEENPRVIDLWGFLKGLWEERLVWLGVFALVFGAGVAYALTRPPVYVATQTVVLSVPRVNSTAEAIQQQSGALNEVAFAYAQALLRPPMTDAILGSHPEIASLQELQGMADAEPLGNTIDIESSGTDPVASAKLVSDLSTQFIKQLPLLTAANPPPLRYVAKAWGNPTVAPATSPRRFLLVAAAALATLVATALAVARGSSRRS